MFLKLIYISLAIVKYNFPVYNFVIFSIVILLFALHLQVMNLSGVIILMLNINAAKVSRFPENITKVRLVTKVLQKFYYKEVCGFFIHICSNSPVLNGRLPFWEDSSRPPVSSWNLPFWDNAGLNVRFLWIFQVNHTFNKLDIKILAASNEISFASCSLLPISS